MTRKYHKSIGNLGETIALKYLLKNGYQILATNFTVRGGQIDLVSQTKQSTTTSKIIFCEVKTRTTNSFGLAEESIFYHQKTALLRTAQIFLANHNLFHCYWQFDLISINLNLKTQPPLATIKHIQNIFAE